MEKCTVYIRLVKNPKDWLKASKERTLSKEESEEVGYKVYESWYSEDGTKVFFKGSTAFGVREDWVLSSNVVRIVPYPSPAHIDKI